VDERRKAAIAIDAIAHEFDLLCTASAPAASDTTEGAIALVRAGQSLAGANHLAEALDSGDMAAIVALWDAVAAARDQIRRAEAAVDALRKTHARTGEVLQAAGALTLAHLARRQRRTRVAAARADGASGARLHGDNDPTPITILVVDDVADVRRMYAAYFEHAGARSIVAANGAEALRLVHEKSPSAVLLDLSMPGKDGWAVLASVRGDPQTAKLPIIALTGHDDEGTREQALRAGADLYLTKPCLPHVVFGLLLQVLGEQERSR
jgi:two-component system cell cycle response regulator DivK